MLLLPLTFLLCNSVTISLVFLSFSLCFSFGYPFHLFVGLSMCLYLSIFLFSPLPKFCLTHVYPYPLSLSSFSLLLGSSTTRVSILLPLPLFSFYLSLSPLPPCSQSFATEENYSLSILETPTLDHETNFFHRGEFPLPSYIRILFAFFFFFQGTIMTSGMIFWG